MKQSINEFERFFLSKKLASTYKPMFLKCLLDLGNYPNVDGGQWVRENGNSIIVDLNFIAARFIRFYWPLYFKFKLKQAPTPLGIAIYRLLDKYKYLFGKNRTQPALEDLCSKNFEDLRDKVINDGIKPQVLRKLLNDCDIYEITKEGNSIIISKKIVKYMKDNKKILTSALNNVISEYLEKFNNAPKIATKLEDKQPRMILKEEEFKEIIELQGKICFYCENTSSAFAQEHFIPWNYLFDTQPFNIVAACNSCNSSKNDRLPDEKFLEKILLRNSKLRNLSSGYSDDWFKNLYDSCRTEYHGNNPLWNPS